MWTVVWSIPARIDVATIWADATDPTAVARADAQAEAILRSYPYGQAVHLAEGLWRLIVPPLAVFFQIDPAARRVDVLQASEVL